MDAVGAQVSLDGTETARTRVDPGRASLYSFARGIGSAGAAAEGRSPGSHRHPHRSRSGA
jgi:hypothetical protein